jgi:hypothetical protein
MYETIPKNSPTAALRRIGFTLVDSTDLFTPKDVTVTGVKVALSFNGGAFANSTNDIVKVDATSGEYYIELTQGESDTSLGTVRGKLTPTGCALSKLQATIGPLEAYDSPASSLAVAAGGITAASFATDAIDANAVKADAGTEIATAVWASATRSLTDKIGFSLSAAGVQANWDALTSALTTAGSIGKWIVDKLDVVLSTRGTSTYAGADTSGTTTLLSRITGALPLASDYTPTRATKLDNLDAAISSRLATAGYTAPLDAAGVRTAVGLASANLDTQLDALPTNAELATALGTADDAVLAAIAALNNLSSAGAQAAAAAALAAYQSATVGDIPTDVENAAAVLAAATADPIASNIKEVNDVALAGTGVLGDEWEP